MEEKQNICQVEVPVESAVDTRKETRRLWIYLALVFGITYVYTITLIWPRTKDLTQVGDPASSALTQALIACLMFFPALSALLTRLITREGFKNSMVRFHFKGHVRYYLYGCFGPLVLTIVGAALYFLVFPSEFNSHVATPAMPGGWIGVFGLMLLSPFLNSINCFGEEWGWRAYLLPKMYAKYRFLPTVLTTGLIWGLWHAPIIAIGHNYGVNYPGSPWGGILAMCLFCTVVGIFLSYLTLKTKSCWPAVFAHGCLNGTTAIGMLFLAESTVVNRFVGPVSTGIIGGMAFLVVAVAICILVGKKEQKHESL